MALLGLQHGHGDAGHGGGGHGSAGHGAHGHDLGHHELNGGGHGGHSVAHGHHDALTHAVPHGHGHEQGSHESGRSASNTLLGLLSPRVLFSVLLGFGIAGTAGKATLGGVALFVAALVGGLFFEGALVRPLWNFLMGFASRPAHTLESSVLEEARAVTNFDAEGRGLVAVEMNGEIVQILARLRSQERASTRVRSGDRLLVMEVDAARNACVVSRLDGTSKP